MSPPALLGTKLVSGASKLRLLTEPFRTSRPPVEDESAAAFARRKFGQDLLDNLLAPFVSGVYAGDPERIHEEKKGPEAEAPDPNRGPYPPGQRAAPSHGHNSSTDRGLTAALPEM